MSNVYLAKEFSDLKVNALKFKDAYHNAIPYPNIHFNNFFNEEYLNRVLDEFPDLSKINSLKYNNVNEKKFASKGESYFGIFTQQLIHYLQSEPFLKFLQELTSIKETLIGDPYLLGGGLHEIKKGGLLKIHSDFNKHSLTGLDRRLNILIYLNKDWEEKYGGHFELWDKKMERAEKRILPTFNTLAIFSTTDTSYHGHPDPLNCPENRSRKSIALYYYSNGRPNHEINPQLEDHSTLFKSRSGNKSEVIDNITEVKKIIKDFIPPIIFKFMKK
jgi:Rps23 Pro-64 3,4-dihydroxylase Tpa1-like proline 4-hydroxylase